MEQSKIKQLQQTACRVRLGIIEGVHAAKSGHPGGSLSIADILTYLYFEKMNIDPKNPKMPERDRLVLSKGHAAPAWYAVLAERGYFEKAELQKLRHTNGMLQGHPDMKHIPGVDMSSGSLGQGISAACGMALSAKHFGNPYRVYTIVGDGESEEGQVWEAAMWAAHENLDNLVAIVDRNHLQIDGDTADVCDPGDMCAKFSAFGWEASQVDGHDIDALIKALNAAKLAADGRPHVLVANTIKGRGVSFMENQAGWHGKAPNAEQTEQAVAELEAARKEA